MPLTSIGSYLPTIGEFLAHWAAVNTRLGLPANAMKLPGDYAVDDLQDDYTALETAITAVTQADDVREEANGDRDAKRAEMLPLIKLFNITVRAAVRKAGLVNALPKVPTAIAAEKKVLGALDDMQVVWTHANAAAGVPGFTPPLLLGTLTLADFSASLTEFRALCLAAHQADRSAMLARKDRDEIAARVKAHLLQYKGMVISKVGLNDPLVVSVPAISPLPGSTPDPVQLNGMWDTSISQARLSWTASADAHLASYSVRACAGTYKAADETVVAQVAKEELAYETDWGLTAPGVKVSYKVYVVTTTQNEKGSNAISVTRPAS